jgi:hypothetical protein
VCPLGVYSFGEIDTKDCPMKAIKSVRILQKVKGSDGVWRFASIK